MKAQEVRQWALTAGALIGGYLIFTKVAETFGLVKSSEEKSKKKSEEEAKKVAEDLKKVVDKSAAFSFPRTQTAGWAVTLNAATQGWRWNWLAIHNVIKEFTRMRNADALYFISNFTKNNGLTPAQWFNRKFTDAKFTDTLRAGQITPAMVKSDVKAYGKFGITDKTSFTSDEIINKFIDYLYLVAKIERL